MKYNQDKSARKGPPNQGSATKVVNGAGPPCERNESAFINRLSARRWPCLDELEVVITGRAVLGPTSIATLLALWYILTVLTGTSGERALWQVCPPCDGLERDWRMGVLGLNNRPRIVLH